jgi:hypothetical protein
MAFTNDTQTQSAFRKLQRKGYTDDSKALGNESESSYVQLQTSEIFAETISSTPATAVSAGVAEAITNADLTLDPTSNGHAYFATYPTGHASAGQRIRNAIDTSFGTGYRGIVKDSGASEIVALDARNWFYDYTNGIFFQQTASASPAPATIDLWVYTGNFVSDIISGADPFTQYIINDGSRGAQSTSQNLTFTSGQLLLPDGSFSVPSYAFKDNTNTGMTLVDPNILSLVMNGVRVFEIDDTGAATQVTFSIGSASAPAFSFIIDKNTGWFRKAADSLSGSTGGTEIVNWDASGVMSQYGEMKVYDQLSGGFNAFKCDPSGGSTGVNTFTMFGEAPRMRFESVTLDSATRPSIKIVNNNSFIFEGDDHANQTFAFYSGLLSTRSFDAKFTCYGSGSGFTQSLTFQHDGSNGVVSTASGQIQFKPAAGLELQNSGGTAYYEYDDTNDVMTWGGATSATIKYFYRGTHDHGATAGARGFATSVVLQGTGNGGAGNALSCTLKPGATMSVNYNNISLASIDAHPTLGSNNITNLYINFFRTDLNSGYSGTVTNAYHFYVSAPTLSGSGTITTWYGAHIANHTGATNIRAYSSAVNSGSNIHGLYFSGTADNYLNGKLGVGTSAPDTGLHLGKTDGTGATTYAEQTSTPANPGAGNEARTYVKDNKFIIQWNEGGTIRYKYLQLSGTGVTWVHTTTAP